jgi:uncharacterized integral membrane protein (TIGR00697 family)
MRELWSDKNCASPSGGSCEPPTYLLCLLGAYVGMLLTAVAAGSKVFALGPFAASATVFPYALSFWITDFVTETHGRGMATRFVLVGFGVILLANVLFRVAVAVPPAPGYAHQEAFALVFSLSPRLFAAGLGAYLISQFLDVHIFHFLRQRTRGRHLWLRNNASTLLSQFTDTLVFISLAFHGVIDNLLPLVFGQYLIKATIALADTPLLYAALALHHRRSIDEVAFGRAATRQGADRIHPT